MGEDISYLSGRKQAWSPATEIDTAYVLAAGTQGGTAGYNAVTWDGRSDRGEYPGNGIYPIKIIRRSDKKVIGTTYLVIAD